MHADANVNLSFAHRLRFTQDAFDPNNHTLRNVIDRDERGAARMLVFVDSGILDAHPDYEERIRAYARAHDDRIEVVGDVVRVAGGEIAKNDPAHFERALQAIHDARLCRRSYVLCAGGGAVLDMVGFAAATAHRGVRLIRIPSTTLAQDDSGIGVKNGVNRFGKKNYLGVFSVPWAVINDESLLESLSDRDWLAGFSEAVKVGLLKDPTLFAQIEAVADAIRDRQLDLATPILRRSAQLHLEHIVDGGDPFELLEARPLDFGHWAAHKLEQMSDFRVIHGEAVAIGLRIDVIYSELAGLLEPSDTARICTCLDALGYPAWDEALGDASTLMEGLEEFREHLGGRLTITLLRGIGHPIDVHQLRSKLIEEAVARLKSSGKGQPAGV